ncbi:MAG TPA: hypothetical protein VF146_22265, partial [Bryobacteraceae bacterium]
ALVDRFEPLGKSRSGLQEPSDVIARGVFASVPVLARKRRRYSNAYFGKRSAHSLEIVGRHAPHL